VSAFEVADDMGGGVRGMMFSLENDKGREGSDGGRRQHTGMINRGLRQQEILEDRLYFLGDCIQNLKETTQR
jgi:hypothetical protein